MNQSNQNYSPQYSNKILNYIIKQLQKLSQKQSTKFTQISQGCQFLQSTIILIQQSLTKLQQKIQTYHQIQQKQTISNLKNKQNQFIINQLKQKLKKCQKSQQNLQIQTRHLKKQIDVIKKERNKDIGNANKMRECIQLLENKIKQKDMQINRLKQSTFNNSYTPNKSHNSNLILFNNNNSTSTQSTKQLEKQKKRQKQKQEQYKMIQSKLNQLQKDFQMKLEIYQIEIQDKNGRIKNLEEEVNQFKDKEKEFKLGKIAIIEQKSGINSISHQNNTNNQSTSSQSLQQYQLQIRFNQQQKIYTQLQSQYNKLLISSNQLEIQLHQQIHQLKNLILEQKKKNKAQTKKSIQLLNQLAKDITKKNFIYLSNTKEIEPIIQNLRKIIVKEQEKIGKEIKELNNINEEKQNIILDYEGQIKRYKNQENHYKEEIQSLNRRILQKDRQKRMNRRQSSASRSTTNKKSVISMVNNITDNNSNVFNISNPHTPLNNSFGSQNKSQVPSNSTIILQQKYRQMIEIFKNQIKVKQQQITQLQNIQSIDFQNNKIKILKLEEQLADSKNEEKRSQREKKELKDEIKMLERQVQGLKNSKIQLLEKLSKEKQSLKAHNDQKIKLLQEKTTKLRQTNKLLQQKCQQRAIKYNKLKSKLQKLQMYNNQTQKRKQTQIQQMIKKNQTLRIQNKSLQQRINIYQINTKGQTQGKQQVTSYNKDLVEQIQMERDRILEQYECKRKDNLKLKEFNERLEVQLKKTGAKIGLIQSEKDKALDKLKVLIEEKQIKQIQITQVNNNNKVLIEQIQTTKRQLDQLKQQAKQKSKQQYQHLKKQLQTQLIHRKQLQKQLQQMKHKTKSSNTQNQELKLKSQQKQTLNKKLNKDIKDLKIKIQNYQQEIITLKQQNQRKVQDLQRKLSEAIIKENNLIQIINYKNKYQNTEEDQIQEKDKNHPVIKIRQSMRCQGDAYFLNNQENSKQIKLNIGLKELKIDNENSFTKDNENKIQKNDQSTNTDKSMILNKIMISPLQSVTIQSTFKETQKVLTIEKIQSIRVQPTKIKVKMQDYQLNVNNYENVQQFISFLLKSYPNIIQSIQNLQIKKQKSISKAQYGVNTDSQKPLQKNQQKSGQNNDLYILQNQLLGQFYESIVQAPIKMKFDPNAQHNKVQVNLFQNLAMNQDLDDNFDICGQGQTINVGQTALNLQIKQIFTKLCQQLQKIFNGQDISMSMMRILPQHLQDDYNQLVSYVKEKIQEIKTSNQLSFIMAQVGDQPQQIEEGLDNQLKNFIDRKISNDMFSYRKILEQKQALITSLMNQRTMQQHTITQMASEKQQIQEQNQNRFMNQCNIYKKQIKQLKNKLDHLEMNFMSLKNVFKNVLEIWVDENQNQDDLRDNFLVYKKVAKLTQVESSRINYYIFRYREIKGVHDA